MKISYKKIATLLFVNALCWHGLSCTFAAEKQEEVKPGTGSKRKQAEQVVHPVMFSDEYCPSDVTKYTLGFLDIKNDQRALLNSSASCKRLNFAVSSIYADLNKVEKHDAWQDNLSLSPLVLYTINSRILTILGLYKNLRAAYERRDYDRNLREVDAIRFQRLCTQFLKAPDLNENASPKVHVDILQRSLNLFSIPIGQRGSWANEFISDCTNNYTQYLTSMTPQQRVAYKNERALCFYGLQFVSRIQPTVHVQLKEEYLSDKLDNSFMLMLLESLKQIEGLSKEGIYAGVWEKIINLEPSPTISQLEQAAASCKNFAWNTRRDEEVRAKYNLKAAKYLEQRFTALKSAGQNPTSEDYDSIVLSYIYLGMRTKIIADRAKYCAKALEYCELEFKALESAGQEPTLKNYDDIAYITYKAGKSTQDVTDRGRYFDKAVKYYDLEFKAFQSAGEEPEVYNYINIASANYELGLNTQDVTDKGRYLAKAAEYFEIVLKKHLNKKLKGRSAEKARAKLEKIYTYLGDTEKANFYNTNTQPSENG